MISRGPLSQLVPVENAAMPERSVIQWDKDDLEALGLLKVDVLALGMLSAIRRALDLVNGYRGARAHHGRRSTIGGDDPAVFEMIRHADTIGVFQIESRAQMSMLPRLKPRELLRSRDRDRDRASRARSRAAWCIPTCKRRQRLEPVDRSPTRATRSERCSSAPWACRSSRSR